MKHSFYLIILISSYMSSQNFKYFDYLQKADSLYRAQKYYDSGKMFDFAYNSLEKKGFQNVLYNASCTWSLANNKEKAFFYLEQIINNKAFFGKDNDPVTFYNQLVNDTDFTNIKSDGRWKSIVNAALAHKNLFEKKLNAELAKKIEIIRYDDQKLRLHLDSLRLSKKITNDEEKAIWKEISTQDLINLTKLEEIIAHDGWPSPADVGYDNSHALFLVLQHAELSTQEKYFQILKTAVQNKKAFPDDLALLEDRILMRKKKPQLYGSQTLYDKNLGYIIFPIQDVDHLDRRRALVGLQSMSDYVKFFNLDWNIDEYKSKERELYGNYINK